MRALTGLVSCTALAFVVAACGADTDDAPPPLVSGVRGGGPRLHPGSTFVDPEISDVAEVLEDRIHFPAKYCSRLNARGGDVVMGDRQRPGTPGNNPDGFLRKVRSVRCGDKVIVETEPASLPDAFDDLDVDAGFQLPTCEKTVDGPSLGVEYAKTLFDYAGTAKLADGRDVPFNASSAVEASLCFAPRFKLKADVGFLKVNSFEVSATGELQGRLFLTVATTLPPSVDDKMRAELAGKPLTRSHSTTLVDRDVPIASLGVGGFKLPITAHTSATLACDFVFTAPLEVKTGATATASLTAGVSYADGKLTPIFDKTASFVPTPPTFTKDGLLHAVCTITPKIELKMFGLATAELTTRTRVGLGAQQTCGGKDAQGVTQKSTSGDVEASVSAAVLAKLDVFGIKKWKKECTLFEANASARYDRTFAAPGGAAAVCTPLGPFPVPPPPAANPQACFGETQEAEAASPIIAGACTHDVCTAGEKLGQACDSCTMQVCAVDAYCCDTYWGASCFERVEKLCGKSCTP